MTCPSPRLAVSAALSLAALVLAAPPAAAQSEDVVWTAASGVTVTGNSLTKTAATAWGNAGAVSRRVLEFAGWAEFTATETNTYRMCGVSKGDSGQSYTDVDHAIYVTGSATVEVYESGASLGSFGSYAAGDRFRVEAGPGFVRYLKNGAVFYTSTKAPQFPLLVDTALYTTGATLTNVRTGELAWTGATGLSFSSGTLTKTGGTAGWNAGAASATRIEYGTGAVEWTATETSARRAAGLSRGDSGTDVADVDYALVLGSDGRITIQEAGISRGDFGPYVSGDRLRVELSSGSVRYRQNGTLLYTSAVAPVLPLSVDTAFDTTGATLTDLAFSVVLFTNATGVSISGSSLTKTGGTSGWNAGAASSTQVASGDGYVEFTATETTTSRILGFTDNDTGAGYTDIDFAISVSSAPLVEVFEAGVSRGTFGAYASNDRFRIDVQNGVVKYRKNGVVFYTSSVAPAYPLMADASLDTTGATLTNVVMGDLVWKNDAGVSMVGNDLVKTASTAWGNAGAATTRSLASGDGFVEFLATEKNTYRMVGASTGDANQNYTEIDFAIYLTATPTADVYENGVYKGSFGAYAGGDRFRVEVEAGVVKYKKNGTVFYTSAAAPVYPLLVDTAFYSTGASVAQVRLDLTVPQVATPTFSPPAGTYTSAQTVTISTTTSGATLRYTTDGSEPTESSALYGSPVSIGTTTTLKAKGFKSGILPSETATGVYTMNFGTLPAPTVSPAAGTYESSVTVTISAQSGATIRTTTDGTEPTTSSTVYTAPVTLTVTTTLKAKGWHPDYSPSATTTATYTILVATPTLTPGGGTYAAGTTITVATATSGATIRYTLTGIDPTTSDPVIASGGTLVAGNYTLKAMAWKAGCTTSAVATATYTVTGSLTSGSAAGGWAHSVVTASDGTVWAFGGNTYGELGDGTTTARSVPGRVAGLTGVTAVAAGAYFGMALRNDGSVWTWGHNGYGQLGDGTTTNRTSPIQVAISNVIAIAAGENHALAVKSDGSAWAWGINGYGQLGDGTTTQRNAPVQVSGLSGATAVAAGWLHSLARKSDGTVWAFGYNASGQFGDGTTTDRWTPVRADGLSGITAVASGVSSSHSVALRDDGTVWAFGANSSGQLGDGTSMGRITAVRVSGLSGVASIGAGSYHSLARKTDGSLWSWGHNGWGQLGDGTTTFRYTPVSVAGLSGLVAAGGGSNHTLAIDTAGSVWVWGYNGTGCIGDGTTVTRTSPRQIAEAGFAWKVGTPTFSVASGTYNANQTVTLSCATSGANIHYTTNGAEPTTSDPFVTSGGTVSVTQSLTLKAKGFKSGMPSSHTSSETYTLKPLTPTASPAAGTYTTAQSVTLSCATSGVTIRYTTDGSEPTETSTAYTAPVSIATTTTLKAKAFKTGWTASDTLTATYTLNLGTLAAPTMSPAAGTYVDSVSVTMSGPAGATIRTTTDGTDPTTTSTAYTAPVTLTVTTTLKAKAFDPSYTASATTTNVYTIKVGSPTLSPAAGTYAIGQLVTASGPSGATLRYTVSGADPTSSDATLPSGGLVMVASATIKVRGFRTGCDPGDVASAAYTITGTLPGGGLAAGNNHSLAREGAGNAWSWGDNAYGQLGDGTTTNRLAPVSIQALSSVTGLAGGQLHSLAVKSDGTAWAFGANGFGQLGDGTTTGRLTPVAVSGLTGVSQLAAAHYHSSLALKTDGSAWSWGYNASGQLGDGTTTNRLTPVQVSGLSGVTAVAAGSSHGLALKSDGSVWSWGYNGYGQLGDGTTTNRLTPVQVSGLTGVVAIAAGYYHSLALKSDGTIVAWGYNIYGGLGDGTWTSRTTPVAVVNMSGARTISAGSYHSLASRADGSAWSWGYNAYSQLGDGTTTNRSSPVQVATLAGIVAVATGDHHCLAMDKDGAIWSWGYNAFGQVGDGTAANRLVPVKLSDAAFAWKVATPTMSPAGGSYLASQTVTVTCVTAGATIYTTTNGVDPTTSDPTVASGGTVTVGSSLTLKAKAWKTGMPASNVGAETYTLVAVTPTASPIAGTYNTDQNVTLTTTTPGATIRYTTDGTSPTESSTLYTVPILVDKTTTIKAKAWKTGWTPSGELSATYTMKVGTPTLSPAGGSYTAAQTVTVTTVTPGAVLHYTTGGQEPTESSPTVSSGGTVSISRSSTLMVKGWKTPGWSTSDTASGAYTIALGTVATPTFSPAAGTYGAAQVVTISTTTPGATIRYTTDGGEPTFTSRLYLAPITVDWTTTVKAKAFKRDWTQSTTASAAYTINLTNTASPADFSPAPGRYTTTQTVSLTTSTTGALIHYTTNGNEPTQTDPSVSSGGTVSVDRSLSLKAKVFKTGMTASPSRRADYEITGAIAAGYNHGLALKVDGSVWGWGLNGSGQVGNGTTTTVTAPVQVLTGARALAAAEEIYGSSHAVKSDGTLWSWGENGNGQLGDGTTTMRTSPVQTSGLSGVVSVAAGRYHTLAVTSAGVVWAFGWNAYGQLGDGTYTQRTTPVQITTLSDIVAVSAGYLHSLALKRDGTIYAWGYNVNGQLGDGTTVNRNTPAVVPSLEGVLEIAAGGNHSMALRTQGADAGELFAWGENSSGQLGDGTTTSRSVPVRVFEGKLFSLSAGFTQGLLIRSEATGERAIWGAGAHNGSYLTSSTVNSSTTFVRLGNGAYVSVAAGDSFSVALKQDMKLVIWGTSASSYPTVNGFALGTAGGTDDPDGDGLTTAQEWALGTDPWNADTNGDGIKDGLAVASGKSATNVDMDGDGVSNAVEIANGTDPFNADTDGDGTGDATDCFPLDPTRWQCPAPTPGDTTPPVITLTEPTNATLISVVPPL